MYLLVVDAVNDAHKVEEELEDGQLPFDLEIQSVVRLSVEEAKVAVFDAKFREIKWIATMASSILYVENRL